jgi:hypothetical protein|nr:MAG TPA: hypothetical protein [Caudoviricetes sp.]
MASYSLFFAHLPTLCPLLKIKVGSRKALILLGLRVFCPLSHFYFYLIAIKNIEII